MGTFKDSLKKWFYTQGTNPTIADTTRVALLDANGEPIGSQTPAEIYRQKPFLTGNVGIAGISNTKMLIPSLCSPAVLASYGIGVWICEGGKTLVIPKSGIATMQWSTANISGGSGIVSVGAIAADLAGKTKTATIYSTLGSDAPAAKYCLEYAPTGLESDAYYGTGKWWLPSAGELLMIFSHIQEVEYMLSLINGASLMGSDNRYFTSTEFTREKAWFLRAASLGFYCVSTAKSDSYKVIPVTSIY